MSVEPSGQEESFPRELLNRSIEERKEYFDSYLVRHPKLDAAHKQLKDAINAADKEDVIFVFGPTGVGKSTVGLGVLNEIIDDLAPDLEADRERFPVVWVEASSPDKGAFDYKEFYIESLEALKDPFTKRPMTRKSININAESGKLELSRPDSKKLLIRNLIRRRPKVFFIDEAQHLLKGASGKGIMDVMDNIKSIRKKGESLIAMIGTMDLLFFDELSDQVNRRRVDIYFSRYMASNQDDEASFKNIIYSFQKQLPLDNEPNLIDHWEFLFERSIGCVGILKKWLRRSLWDLMSNGEKTLTIKHLEARALKVAQVKKILESTLYGENKLHATQEEISDLRGKLGLPPIVAEAVSPSKRGRPGERVPGRDPVGVANAVT